MFIFGQFRVKALLCSVFILSLGMLSIGVLVFNDITRHRLNKVALVSPPGLDHRVYDDLRDAQLGLPVAWSNLEVSLSGLDDFGLTPLLRIVYRHQDAIDSVNAEKIRRTILGFRYWMDQPGEDSRCYWSENHQILYAAAEYLAGQKYPDGVFAVDGRTGRQHMTGARKRVLAWLEQRWLYGFSEWYSNNYYVFDVGALCNLIDFSDDEEIATKSRIILDLLLYDVATQSCQGAFVSTMGRAYERNRKSAESGDAMRGIIQNIWGFGLPAADGGGMAGSFIFRERYQVPKVIEAIGRDTNSVVIKASQGLDLTELPGEQRASDEDAQIMLQWGMEAFTNPDIIENTLNYVEKHHMFSNVFLEQLQTVDFAVLRKSGLLPWLSKLIDPISNGIPLQRANTYTYRTQDYLLASVQHYHPGTLNDQHHVWSATLSPQLSIFTDHPPSTQTKLAADKNHGYWVGPGRLPDAAQFKNVCMLIYRLPNHLSAGEKGESQFTHAYFPKERFDRVELKESRAYGKIGQTYVALLGSGPMHYQAGSTEDLIQDGHETTWICEVSTAAADGDFDSFINRVEGNPTGYVDGKLTYQTKDRQLELEYNQGFRVNGLLQNSQYSRHDSLYAETPRKPDQIVLVFGGHRLLLDFKNCIRRED